jgi:anthranilate phosphoribosyltransferase
MNNILKQRLEYAALKAEKEDTEYWDREYSGDIELGRAKLRIKELEQELTSFNHLKSISWNLNRIANVLEGKNEEPKEDIAANLRAMLKTKTQHQSSDEVGFTRAMRRHLGGNSDE